MNDGYLRTARFYETDGMQYVHHSNHIRWMEEARMDFMAKRGFSYREMEARGVVMPVVSVSCRYVKPILFDDTVVIYTSLDRMTGVRAKFSYRMETPQGELVAAGESEHCFLDEKTRVPVNLIKRWPEAFR